MPRMNVTVISCSLNRESNSNILGQTAVEELKKVGITAKLVDLREHTIPLCDGDACSHPSIDSLKATIIGSDAILLAVPIYNYDVNSAAKNLVEHTGKAWTGKIVAFLAAAGGHSSYMSIMSLANSLMLDFRCLIVPRFVYATGQDFDASSVTNPKIRERIDLLVSETLHLTKALKK